MKLEKLIDPLLDDDDMVSLAFIITSIIEDRLKVVDGVSGEGGVGGRLGGSWGSGLL